MAGCGNNNKDNQVKQETKISTEQQASFNTQGNDKKISISESGTYTDKEHVAAYINEFAKLPSNYITKQEAKRLGWKSKGSLDKVAPGENPLVEIVMATMKANYPKLKDGCGKNVILIMCAETVMVNVSFFQ